MNNFFSQKSLLSLEKLLGIDSHKVTIEKYNEDKYKDHQKLILSLQGTSRGTKN